MTFQIQSFDFGTMVEENNSPVRQQMMVFLNTANEATNRFGILNAEFNKLDSSICAAESGLKRNRAVLSVEKIAEVEKYLSEAYARLEEVEHLRTEADSIAFSNKEGAKALARCANIDITMTMDKYGNMLWHIAGTSNKKVEIPAS